MTVFSAAPHETVLILLVQVAVLLFTARALGEIAQRFGQPSVVGEISAGIVLGPSLLSGIFPGLGEWLIPQTPVQGYLLELVSMIGAMLLLLITGLETDLVLIRRHARIALGAAAGGLVVPFTAGFVLGQLLPESLLADPQRRLVFSLFVATAMSISAIPVIAKVLMDLQLMRRDVGQTIIAAAMVDDTTAWVLLSLVLGLAGGEAVSFGTVLGAVGKVAGFMLVTFTFGRWLVKKCLDLVQDEVVSRDRLLTLMLVFAFAWGALAQALRLEALLGAFVTGILFGQMQRLPQDVYEKLESFALAAFAPLFFAVAGLKVNIVSLLDPRLIAIALLVILVAVVGKVSGSYLGARWIGRRDHWTALSFGAGLNARGAMEIIIASIGLSQGILSQDMFTIIVLMAITTSLMAPPALRWVLRHVKPEEQELQRLRQEEITAGSRIAQVHRVLVPVRKRRDGSGTVQGVQAKILERMSTKTTLSITLLTIAEAGAKAQALEFLDRLATAFPQQELIKKVVEGTNPADAILEEAQKDYDLLVLGAPEADPGSDALFTSLVDNLVRAAPCLTMVVQGQRDVDIAQWSPRRILVPTDGTAAARQAAELGFALASGDDSQVSLLHVLQQDSDRVRSAMRIDPTRRLGTAYQIVRDLREVGESLGVRTSAEVQAGTLPEHVILDAATKAHADLIILGTAVSAGSTRLFLGARVERMLNGAGCPVVVLNAM